MVPPSRWRHTRGLGTDQPPRPDLRHGSASAPARRRTSPASCRLPTATSASSRRRPDATSRGVGRRRWRRPADARLGSTTRTRRSPRPSATVELVDLPAVPGQVPAEVQERGADMNARLSYPRFSFAWLPDHRRPPARRRLHLMVHNYICKNSVSQATQKLLGPILLRCDPR